MGPRVVTEEYLPSQAKGLVFDCDGTILDTLNLHWEAWKFMCQKYGIQMTAQRLLDLSGMPGVAIIKLLCEEQNLDIDQAAAQKDKKEYYHKYCTPKVKQIDMVVDIIKEAQNRGLPMAVASGGSKEHVVGGLERAGLMDYFQVIVAAEDYTKGKPHPDPFLIAAQRIDVSPEDCVGYEDAVLGMQSIEAAGFLKAIDVTKLDGYPPFLSE